VVERKGLGHPDTVCDAIAEAVSVALCRAYAERFGVVLHHNVDKVLLCGGRSTAEPGGGEVHEPIEIYLAGRATRDAGGVSVPVDELAIEACRSWLRKHLKNLDVDRQVRVHSRIRPGSADLTALFARGRSDAPPVANDTSCGVGFAPLSTLETVVLSVEQALTDPTTPGWLPAIGEDVKVMGVRRGERIDLTIGCAFVARHVTSLSDYVEKKERVRRLALETAERLAGPVVDVALNTGDDPGRGQVYLTVTGTSAEAGDDGEVGRGNRASGLITPYRPMTMEAAAGKNPVTHVGKLYNLVAMAASARFAGSIEGVRDVSCVLVSRIGHPVHDPHVAHVRLEGDALRVGEELRASLQELLRSELGALDELRRRLLEGTVRLF
jgi:S-adenosylmethionine synthetase